MKYTICSILALIVAAYLQFIMPSLRAQWNTMDSDIQEYEQLKKQDKACREKNPNVVLYECMEYDPSRLKEIEGRR